jgi:uncharacterized NAD-dependent epimerase/dehydratase family protein
MTPPSPRYIILADGALDVHDAKTASCLIRYRPEAVLAVIDHEHAGQSVQSVLGFGGPIPIVADYEQAARLGANRLLIGISPPGGSLPPAWRQIASSALRAGMDVVSGLHVFLSEDPELVKAARQGGTRLVDLRAVPDTLGMPSGARERLSVPVILTVGSDCNAGKMTATWELHRQAVGRGLNYGLLATGQTGILLQGDGVPVDRVISDFVAGATEQYVVRAAEGRELLLVEGQGSLVHPYYSAVTLGLMHGCQPDAMVLCHVAGRAHLRHLPKRPVPSLNRAREIYEQAAHWVRPARVIGVALATHLLEQADAERAVAQARAETGLPVEDLIRDPTGELLQACRAFAAGSS